MSQSIIPIAVLISGRGSNLQALMDAGDEGRLRAKVRVVLSNRPDAAGLVRARAAGIETLVVPHGDYATREDYDLAISSLLRERGVELVCLAGFMRMLGPAFCSAFPDAILNIHPSLLPAFPGVDAQLQALRHGVKVTGATVHLVIPERDAGPIVEQAAVRVLDEDTEATLGKRILQVEHRIYPTAAQRILSEPWRVEGRRVVFLQDETPRTASAAPR